MPTARRLKPVALMAQPPGFPPKIAKEPVRGAEQKKGVGPLTAGATIDFTMQPVPQGVAEFLPERERTRRDS